MEKAQGTLTTPNWPESDYPPGVSCSWHIIAPPDQVLAPLLVLTPLGTWERGASTCSQRSLDLYTCLVQPMWCQGVGGRAPVSRV